MPNKIKKKTKKAQPRKIREEDGARKEWYAQAKTIKTPEELAAFVDKLCNGYVHDYGTICHAVAAAALAAARCVDNSESGGITGFQAGMIMWLFLGDWMGDTNPKRLVHFAHMLYPQYDHEFTKHTITKSTWEWLQERARKKLDESKREGEDRWASDRVVAHWQSIVDGKIPFGYTISES